jgi:predicted house-cleaning NTP pyrophosphatase (Maf/HAM1 superfamily)
MPSLILASSSPRRAELLRQLNLEFQVLPSDVPEVEDDHLSPFEVCQLNAHRKARAVAKKYPDTVVLGADTLVCLDMTILQAQSRRGLRNAGAIRGALTRSSPLSSDGCATIGSAFL